MVATPAAAFANNGQSGSGSPSTECTTTIYGGTYHGIEVPDGATCAMLGVNVTHSVRVGAGSRLIITDSEIGQHIMGQGARSVRVIDTNVYGQIHLWETTHSITIGTDGCAVDPIADGNIHLHANLGTIAICQMTIRNNLLLQNNKNRIGVYENRVGNNIQLSGNSGPGIQVRLNTVRGNIHASQNDVEKTLNIARNVMGGQLHASNNTAEALRLRRNDIGKNINCVGNDPAPIDQLNVVGGQRLGQCA
jgi:hypothetical protein